LKNILSIDVEDWYHILDTSSTPGINEWSHLKPRVTKNFYTLLDVFDTNKVKVTCFFLGWIAEKFPNLVKEADRRGHEIASHGYAHQLIYKQSRVEFAEDIRKAKELIETISGKPVLGYRAPGFSIIESTKWAFDELSKAGYLYDSSIFPTVSGHGGIIGAKIYPHKIESAYGSIIEFPITVVQLLRRRFCFFGGGYIRLFPYWLIRHFSKKVNNEGRPVVYYLHPREIDPEHPRLSMGINRRFKSYVNLHTTMKKIRKLTNDEKLIPFKDWIFQYGNLDDID